MEKTKLNVWKIIGIIVPIVIYTALLLVGTLYDLQISQALVKGLENGKYYTTNTFASLTEIFLQCPIWFACVFASICLFRFFDLKEAKVSGLKYVFALATCGLSAAMLRDFFKYYFRYGGTEWMLNKLDMLAIYGLFGLFVMFLGCYLSRKMSKTTATQLTKMALVTIFACMFFLVCEVLKSPIGRIRYRTMYVLDDFSYYVPWYHFGSKKGIPEAVLTVIEDTLPSDALKSCPSGHTFAATFSFIITCLPLLFKNLDKKWIKIVLYVIAIGYTVFVGMMRVVAGAHFFSDVVLGSIVCYTAIRVGKLLFIKKEIGGKLLKYEA